MVRNVRNNLLAESDWVNNPDVPISSKSKKAWLKYRQDLRDFMERENPTMDSLPEAPPYEKQKAMKTLADLNAEFFGLY